MDKKKERGSQRLKYVLFLLKPFWKYGKAYVFVTLLCSMLLQPAQTYLSTILPKIAIDAVVNEEPRNKIILTILPIALTMAVIGAVQMILNLVNSNYANGRIINKIRNDINRKALYSDYKYYDDPAFYSQFAYAQEHFPNQAFAVSYALPLLLKDIVTLIAMGSIILSADIALVFISLLFIAISSFVDYKKIKPTADYHKNAVEVWKPFYYALQALKQKEDAAELRSSDAGEKLLNMAEGSFDDFRSEYKTFAKKTLPYAFIQGLISPVQMAVILAYIVLFIINGDINKIGLYASLTAATTVLSGNLTSIFGNINTLLNYTTQGEQIKKFFEAKSEIEPPAENKVSPPEEVFDVELRNVSFGYDNSTFSLNKINMNIKAGQRIAIVGENGAGKSTLIKLLLRLYDVSDGEILINGTNVKKYDVHKLRMKIGTAFQNERILAMTLRENLTIYHNASDEKLIEVINKVGLGKICKSADGLDAPISREFEENGIVLSGGEAQRLAIARLFTGDFGLLLLDEPSSALDPFAEANLMKNILDIANASTTIMVAHRLSTVRDFDMIYYMESGEIAESGTHDELMALGGKYCEMFKTQGEKYQMDKI